MKRATAPGAALRWSSALRNQLQNERLLAELCLPDAPRRIGIAGCHAGAGASTVALNLALLLRERQDSPVWLVEADLRRPVLAGWLGVAGGGFNRLAEGETTLADCGVQDAATGLHLLAATAVAQPLLLLQKAAERLAAFTGERLLVDLPPVLGAPDATLLAPRLDGVLLVLEAEGTRWEVAREARHRLEAAGARVIGAVLNKKPHPIPNWLYRLL
jgi:Mrp family chromosome partitioning ATPase